MFIYNVTTKVAAPIEAPWLVWLQGQHIPDMMATECFSDATILQLLEIDDDEGPTFAIQYKVESKALYNRFIEKHTATMRQKAFDKWGNQFIAFHSFMQVVD